MAFAFDRPDEPVAQSVHRLAGRMLRQASVDVGGGKGARGVFGARKSIKKTRALLRLIRDGVTDFDRLNAELRDIGRAIAANRDAEVLPLTAARLAQDAPADVATGLSAVAGSVTSGLVSTSDMAEVSSRLSDLADGCATWKISGKGFGSIEAGIARGWTKARRLAEISHTSGDSADLHEWRKRVKDHWYHARLLSPIWPELMSVHAATVGQIAEHLGEHQDVEVLLEHLGAAGLPVDQQDAVRAHARDHAVRLETKARSLANRLFFEDADTLVQRWHVWWHLWRRAD